MMYYTIEKINEILHSILRTPNTYFVSFFIALPFLLFLAVQCIYFLLASMYVL